MREVVAGASGVILLRIVGACLSFGLDLAVARLLGAAGSGVFFQVVAVVTIASVVGRRGLDNTLLRFTATHEAAGERGLVRAVGQLGIKLAVAPLAIVAVALFVAAPFLAVQLFREPALSTPLRIIALAVLPAGLLQLLAQMLRGVGRIAHSVLVQSVWVPGMTVCALLLAAPWIDVVGAVWAYAGAALATMVIGATLWHARIRSASGGERYDAGVLRASSRPLYAVALMQLMFQWGTIVMLGAFRPSAEVALFSAATRTAMLLSFVLLAVNHVAGPKFAALHSTADITALEAVARGSARLMTLASLPGLVILLLFPRWVMGVFGPEFQEGAAALVILALGQFVNVVTGSVGLILMMTGHEATLRNVHVVSFGITVALGLALCAPFGAVGAAVAASTGLATKNLIATFIVRRSMGFWSIPTWSAR